jgi:metal-responsive CopG/Arc/MetJ family transcriptional regulator
MPRAEEFPIKFQFAITEEMNAAIADWRRQQADLPNRSEAIRRLIERGLSANEPESAASRRPAKNKNQ